LLLHVRQQHGHVVGLAGTGIVHAFGTADAAEIHPYSRITELVEGARQGLRDLVVHRAAVQRMRMRNQRDASRGWKVVGGGQVERAFELTGSAAYEEFFGLDIHAGMRVQIFRRSTTLPPIRWLSMISSISSLST
jgi:hypothetical protein